MVCFERTPTLKKQRPRPQQQQVVRPHLSSDCHSSCERGEKGETKQPQEALRVQTQEMDSAPSGHFCQKSGFVLQVNESRGQKGKVIQVAAVSNPEGWSALGEGATPAAQCCFSPTVVKSHMCITHAPSNAIQRHPTPHPS